MGGEMSRHGVKSRIIECLWNQYIPAIPYYRAVFSKKRPVLDHLAIIDLPASENTGIPFLKGIFSGIGFKEAGSGYLPEKQNDFVWMLDPDSHGLRAEDALPQIVLADFRIENFSSDTQKVLNKYISTAAKIDISKVKEDGYLEGFLLDRSWDVPTIADYELVKSENQLLAWVLLFGRGVNHFGANITFDGRFKDLWDFNSHVKTLGFAELNCKEGEVKGGAHQGIAQSSTLGMSMQYKAADGVVEVNNSFMEFVWRYPKTESPVRWGDYFTGFVAENANHVIESLYDNKK